MCTPTIGIPYIHVGNTDIIEYEFKFNKQTYHWYCHWALSAFTPPKYVSDHSYRYVVYYFLVTNKIKLVVWNFSNHTHQFTLCFLVAEHCGNIVIN